eukprot:748586-Ditylum_brightwellii.AAC.1
MGGALRKRGTYKDGVKPFSRDTLRTTRQKRNNTDDPKETPEKEEEKIEGGEERGSECNDELSSSKEDEE